MPVTEDETTAEPQEVAIKQKIVEEVAAKMGLGRREARGGG
jgi:hypothetical protein